MAASDAAPTDPSVIVPSSIRDFQSSARRPSDFDEFWQQAQSELERVPLSILVERSGLRSTPDVDAYEVTFASVGGLQIFGWLCIPTGPGRHAGLVVYPGYSGSPSLPRAWARQGYAVLQVSPRGHHMSDGVFRPGFPGLMTSGIDDPRTYAYRGLYCDAWRAVDVLLSRPEVDPDRVGVTGGSQGGALSLIATAGRPQVRCVAADVPFMTSIRDGIRLGSSYPYEEVKDYLRLQPQLEERVLSTLDYVDTVNFSDRIRVPTLLSVGLRDDICPPQTAFGLYNRLTSPKDVRVYPDGAHEGGGFLHGEARLAWLNEQLAPGRVIAS